MPLKGLKRKNKNASRHASYVSYFSEFAVAWIRLGDLSFGQTQKDLSRVEGLISEILQTAAGKLADIRLGWCRRDGTNVSNCIFSLRWIFDANFEEEWFCRVYRFGYTAAQDFGRAVAVGADLRLFISNIASRCTRAIRDDAGFECHCQGNKWQRSQRSRITALQKSLQGATKVLSFEVASNFIQDALKLLNLCRNSLLRQKSS